MTKIKGRTQTGAWIETLTKKSTIHYWTGRTQTGAWIETMSGLILSAIGIVAPKRVRGLKLAPHNQYYIS